MNHQLILVLDFGGQYKELIARMVRSLSVYSEIRPGSLTAEEIQRLNPIGIILTGGPDSVYLPDSPQCDPDIFKLGIPILGICYGMQLMCHVLGGEVEPCGMGEYGRVEVTGVGHALMSHRDIVTRLPDGFIVTASTENCPIAACQNSEKNLCGVQFHPESAHTDGGREIFREFLYDICGASGDYRLDDYISTQIEQIRGRVGKQKVLLALSGGVDSSVCAALLAKAVPRQLVCVFVDHGFMRQGEGDEIERVFSKRRLRFLRVNAAGRFLAKIKGVTDPEAKRKIIGEEFVGVFEEEAAKLGDIPFLAQGTIYPDIVESGGAHGATNNPHGATGNAHGATSNPHGATIKSHHNVGGLPEKLNFIGIIEPLAGLFKDEVRALGRKLGLPASLVKRQPFPGPGLAIRIMGEVTEEKLAALRHADYILRDEVGKFPKKPQQYFAVLTDTRTVGVKGDGRTYDYCLAIRAVDTTDFMTCEYSAIPHKALRRISARITSEVPTVSRVVYDITSKPPATVEWE